MTPTDTFWDAYPFPHIILDNFIPPKIFRELSVQDTGLVLPTLEHNRSELEKNKHTSNNTTNALEQYAHDLLTSRDFLQSLRGDYFNDAFPLQSLRDFPNHTFQYFHKSYRGAKLGRHVDHCQLDGKVHILNAIYYSHPEWYSSWGGYTTLYDSRGNEIQRIEPKPNRLLLFFHDSNSFHGCSEVFCPSDSVRRTIYTDYYTSRCNLPHIILDYYSRAQWWEHGTTFAPVIGSGKFLFYVKGWLHYKWNKYRKVIQ